MAASITIVSLLLLGVFCGGTSGLLRCRTGFSIRGNPQLQQQQAVASGSPLDYLETTTSAVDAQQLTVMMWIQHQTTTDCPVDFLRINIMSPPDDQIDATSTVPQETQALTIGYGTKGLAVSLEENQGLAGSNFFLPVYVTDDDGEPTGSLGTLSPGWHHLALTWSSLVDCGQALAYLDGQHWGGGQLPLQLSDYIGRGEVNVAVNPAACGYTARFTDLQVHSRVLSAREVARVASCQAQAEGDLVSYKVNEFQLYGSHLKKAAQQSIKQMPCCDRGREGEL